MNWYFEVLRKYFDFSGRARRKEYWWFVFFNALISFALACIAGAIGLSGKQGSDPLSGLYTLAVLIPGLAVSVRRLHDTDRSGWWILLALFPCIGGIILFIFMVQEGTNGENQYGEDPAALEE